MNLSALEDLVVDGLLRRVRVLAFGQIETLNSLYGFDQSSKFAMRKLVQLGLVEAFTIPTIVLQLHAPLFSWHPRGTKNVDFSKIAWLAKSRFLNSNVEEHRVFHATETAEQLLGGVGGALRQPNQIMHDLGTSAVFLARQRYEFDTTKCWIGEDVLRRSWRHQKLKKIPDAALIEDEQLKTVIEFAGRDYGKAYLEKFHQFWLRREKSYEIW